MSSPNMLQSIYPPVMIGINGFGVENISENKIKYHRLEIYSKVDVNGIPDPE